MLMPSPNISAGRLRVLQAVFTMHSPETQEWLMSVWRGMDKDRYQFDFLTFEGVTSPYDDEIKKLGGRLIPVPSVKNKRVFLRAVRKAMVENGPYDIMHAHAFSLSGLIQRQAARAKIPVRLTHAHADRRKSQRNKTWQGRLYGWWSRKLINRYSTHGIAATMEAATAQFGENWWFDPRWQVMPNGIDLAPFEREKNDLRPAWGLTPKSKVIGHIGDFRIEQNHDFLIAVFEQIAAGDPTAILLLIGDGPLREQIEQKVAERKLTPRVIFTGTRSDTADCLRAMDLFIYPAIYEGTGRHLIAAQAAGLPCIVSDALPQDLDIAKGSVAPLSLDEGIDPWVDKAREILAMPKPHAALTLDLIRASDYTLNANIKNLSYLYERLYAERFGE